MGFTEDAREIIARDLAGLPDRVTGYRRYVQRRLLKQGTDERRVPYLLATDADNALQHKSILTDEELLGLRGRIALIGNGGAGKTLILAKAYERAGEKFLRDSTSPIPFFLMLEGDLGEDRDLEKAFYRYGDLLARVRGEWAPGALLLLDAWDQVIDERQPRLLANSLKRLLSASCAFIKAVFLGCRRAVWDDNWFRGDDSFSIYHADYIGDDSYAELLGDGPTVGQLRETAEQLGIDSLLSVAITGFDIATKFAQGEALPTSRTEWFGSEVHRFLKGSKSDREKGSSPPAKRLTELAQQLACLASFSQHPRWTPQGAVDLLGQSRALSSPTPVRASEINCLLRRPLFTKAAGKFRFTHELFREYLTASAIKAIRSERKRRQLLAYGARRGQDRVFPALRGLATFLSGLDETFRDFLIANDPMVAFSGEPMDLSEHAKDSLLRAVLDRAVKEHRAYWWSARGSVGSEEAVIGRNDVLKGMRRYRVSQPAKLLKPYLVAPSEMARLWATKLASEWGGVPELNPVLLKLAFDDSQHSHIREDAARAVIASGSRSAIRKLYPLISLADEELALVALRGFWNVERPSPKELIGRLSKVKKRPHYVGGLGLFLYHEYPGSLSAEQLEEALRAADGLFDQLGPHGDSLLYGLLRCAKDTHARNVPPGLILKIWLREHTTGHTCGGREAEELVTSNPALFAETWALFMKALASEVDGRSEYPALARRFGRCCTDDIFALVPKDDAELSSSHKWAICNTLSVYLQKEPTENRLQAFKRSAPAFTDHLFLPTSAADTVPAETEPDIAQLREIIGRKAAGARQKTYEILMAFGAAEIAIDQLDDFAVRIARWLGGAPNSVAASILDIFRQCVSDTVYKRAFSNRQSVWQRHQPLMAVPALVLMKLDEPIPVQKLAQFLRCFAFSFALQNGPTAHLLDTLRTRDDATWRGTVRWLSRCPDDVVLDHVLRYAAALRASTLLSECRRRLSSGVLTDPPSSAILTYWRTAHPRDLKAVLRGAYRWMRAPRPGLASAPPQAAARARDILQSLLEEDDDWAWSEFHRCVRENDIVAEPGPAWHRASLPNNPARLPVMADWLALSRRKDKGEHARGDIGDLLEAKIEEIDGEAAIHELKRLQQEQAFPGVEWLSYHIIRIEDRLLAQARPSWKPGQILDFVNKSALAIVHSERDLFEWVCEALEKVKRGMEDKGESLAGFWDCDRAENTRHPKIETDCHDVLWPRLQSELSSGMSLAGVDERRIGRNKADFWVLKTPDTGQPFEVAIELKTVKKNTGRPYIVGSVETQLWNKYLRPSGCKHGIHLVLWFKHHKHHNFPRTWPTIEDLRAELEKNCEEVSLAHDVRIRPYIIDMTNLSG